MPRVRLLAPYRAHEKDRQRLAAAPIEVKRLEIARQRRYESELRAGEEHVASNRARIEEEHAHWTESKRALRAAAAGRVQVALRERASRLEEVAASVEKYQVAVAKQDAKKAMREAVKAEDRANAVRMPPKA